MFRLLLLAVFIWALLTSGWTVGDAVDAFAGWAFEHVEVELR